MVDIGGYTVPGTDPNNLTGGNKNNNNQNPLSGITDALGNAANGIKNSSAGTQIVSDLNNNVNTNGFGGNGGTFDPRNLVDNMYNSINNTLTNSGLPKDQIGATITDRLGSLGDFITGVDEQKKQAWQNQVAADAAATQATNLANQNTQNQQTDLASSNAAGALRSQQASQGSGPVLATNANGVATYMPSSASSVAQRDFLGLS